MVGTFSRSFNGMHLRQKIHNLLNIKKSIERSRQFNNEFYFRVFYGNMVLLAVLLWHVFKIQSVKYPFSMDKNDTLIHDLKGPG